MVDLALAFPLQLFWEKSANPNEMVFHSYTSELMAFLILQWSQRGS